MLILLTPVVIAYLLGAIPSGLLIARLFGVRDIRTQGSGNIGATNVWRVVGLRAAIWVYVFDISKGVAAVMIARQFHPSLVDHDVLLVVCAVCVVLGNVFPVFLKFKGGKGVNTSLGAVLTLLPWQTLIGLGMFLIVAGITRYISLGSITAGCTFALVVILQTFVFGKPVAIVYVVLAVALAAMIILTHRQNIGRLLAGTENRFSRSSKTNGTGSHA